MENMGGHGDSRAEGPGDLKDHTSYLLLFLDCGVCVTVTHFEILDHVYFLALVFILYTA